MFNNFFNLDSPNMNNSIFFNFFVVNQFIKNFIKLEHHITGLSSLLCLFACVYFAGKKHIKITMKNKI